MGASGLCCDTSIPTEVGELLNARMRTFYFIFNGLGMMHASQRYVVSGPRTLRKPATMPRATLIVALRLLALGTVYLLLLAFLQQVVLQVCRMPQS